MIIRHKKKLNRFFQNNILENLLEQDTLIDIVLQNLPGKHISEHNNKSTNYEVTIKNTVFYFIKLTLLILKYSLKANKGTRKIKQNYDFLILVPNAKFIDYYRILYKELNGYKLAISLEDIGFDDQINLKQYIPDKLKIIYEFSMCIFGYSILSIRDKLEFKKILNNLDLLQKFIFNLLILNRLFKRYTFIKYLSLMPNIDHHYIIEKFFPQEFRSTYAIRPTSTSLATEHQYISTQNLFYKSPIEKGIFIKLLIDKGIKLLPASLIISQNELLLQKIYPISPKKILFLDTCLSRDSNFNIGRDNCIVEYYKCLSNHIDKVQLYHKFHPGLGNKERKKIISKYSYVNFINDYDNEYLTDIDLIVGFYSTVFHYAMLHKIPIIHVSNYFNLKNEENAFRETDLDYAPISSVSDSANMRSLFHAVFNSSKSYISILKSRQLREYIIKEYNYPQGLLSMIKALNQ